MKQKYIVSLLAVSIGVAVSTSASAAVLISEYVEGTSYNKAIEIANTGTDAVDLSAYTLAKSTNGSGVWEQTLSLAGQTLAPQGVLVIAHGKANADILSVADIIQNSVTGFNGNDPVALLKDGQVVDIVGQMGDAYWGKDVTLVRQSLSPSTTYQASQWQVLNRDDISSLGTLDSTPVPTFSCDPQMPFTSISAIQGEGASSPMAGDEQTYQVQGVVSAVTTGLTKGFYLQSLTDDDNPHTSNGLFVYTGQGRTTLQPGDVVCTQGKVKEYYGLTELAVSDDQWVKTDEQAAPEATPIEILPTDKNFQETLERYEGMLVKTTADLEMKVTRTFGYDYAAKRNNMVLAQGRINMHPNQNFPAGSAGSAQQSLENQESRLFVESDQKAPNGKIPYYPAFGRTDVDQDGSTEDYIRVDDTVIGLEGVLTYDFNNFRLIVTNTLSQDNFVHNEPRTQHPVVRTGGNLRIASFNVLNYFNSPFGGDENPLKQNRGAASYAEFEVQETKIVKAIKNLNADIVGLMEIENNGFGDNSAIERLVTHLNAMIPDEMQQYTFVGVDSNHDGQLNADDKVGTDAITTGVLYRKSVVQLLKTRVIEMPHQQAPEVIQDGKVIEDGKNYQRNTIAPTFLVNGRHRLTVAVNHFKSKGSTCWEDAAPESEGGQGGTDPDFQGSCERFRVAAAVALGNALERIRGSKVILGDMNAYAKEDPMLVLTDYTPWRYGKTIRAARDTYIGDQPQFGEQGAMIWRGYGYLNATSLFHDQNWSYSYNDEVGALDHILISPELRPFVVDATDWHINAGESTLFDYTNDFKGDFPKYSDIYRASDHDPAVIDLNVGGSLGAGFLLALAGVVAWRRR